MGKKKKEPKLIIEPPKAPALLKGPPPVDVKKMLSEATPEQIKALTHENFALWCQFSGVKVDDREFNFDKHRYLLPLYLDSHKNITLIKAAQMGATIYLLLRILWFARHHQVKVGLYFPTKEGVENLSKDRLKSLIASNPELSLNMSDTDTLGLKKIRNIHGGESAVYLSYLGGSASKDSVPLDMVAFDEVRLVSLEDIGQAGVRTDHSEYKYKLYVSTAGRPGQTIDRLYRAGHQAVWTIRCGCSALSSEGGFVPSECFPDCIVEHRGEVYLRCPRCKYRIYDGQNGSYVIRNPAADKEAHSYSISKFVADQKYSPISEIWKDYKDSRNGIGKSIEEFYNATLGKPYIDHEAQPVNMDILENCINPDLKWAYDVTNRTKYKNCAMGIDQRGGQNHVIIMARSPDNKPRIVHIEEIDDKNPRYWEHGKPVTPFKRLYELMREFDVSMCICDAMPNFNEAHEFARTFPGRVFLSWYQDSSGPDVVKWSDKLKMKEAVKRGSKEIKLKWQVMLRRYDSLDTTLALWGKRAVEIPDPNSLVQVYRNPETAVFEPQPIAKLLFTHLMSLVKEEEAIDPKANDGRTRTKYVFVGRDPHFAHAFNYCWFAFQRMKRQAIFV